MHTELLIIERNPAIFQDMEGTGDHYVKGNKPCAER
jgi:hypothetical protein